MGRVFGYLGGCLAIQAAVWLLLIVLVPCSVSAIEVRPELRCGNTVMGMEYVDSGMGQALFHEQTLAADQAAALAIDFPAASGNGAAGLTIAQTGAGTTAAASTGFFFSNFQFAPVVNVGAAPVGAGQFGKPCPVKAAAFTGKAVMYPEMVVRGNLLGKGDLPAVVSAGFSFPPAQAVVANETVWKLGKLQSDRNAMGLNAIDKGLPVILSAHKFDFVSTPEQISKTSILMRLWRNTHQGSMLNFMYEGDAAYPEWIAPVKNPMQLIDCGDSQKAIKSALEMTLPGKYLSRSFWSL